MSMGKIRTDLAMEAREIWKEDPEKTGELPGVEAQEETLGSFKKTTVKILDERGEQELCKPKGSYVTLELDALIRREENSFENAVGILADEIRSLLKLVKNDTVLVAGLGNRDITPDAVGPQTVSSVLVTRHLKQQMPNEFAGFRNVAALETGVLGTTGLESADMVSSVSRSVSPNAVIAVDALASRRMDRLCRTVQLADTGIVPGSGVGNGRAALNHQTLGVPVIAIGVPTVVDAATLTVELAQQAGVTDLKPEALGDAGNMIVTPRDIDNSVRDVSRLIGYAINLALHDGLTISDVDMLLG